MFRYKSICSLCLTLAVLLASAFPAIADDAASRTAPELLPKSTLFYAELTEPGKLVDLALESPVRKRIEELDEVKQAMQQEDFQKLLQLIGHLEERVGQKLPGILKTITGNGIHVAFDPATMGVAVLVESQDAKTVQKTYDVLLEVARSEAEKKGEELPVKTGDYRGITTYKTKEGGYALVGPWVLITNRAVLGRMMIDRYLDGDSNNLAADPDFKAARKTVPTDASGWAFFKVGVLRDSGLAPQLFKDHTNNPGAEILAAGVLESLRHTPYATASFTVDEKGLRMQVAAACDRKQVNDLRKFYFSPQDAESTFEPLLPKETLASLTTYRDVVAFWHQAEDMFDDNVASKFVEADSGLSLFFSGKDFSTEILSQLGPRMQFVAARQIFSGPLVPDIKLPAGAVILEVKNPKEIDREAKIAFQSLMGLTNIGAGQNRQPQFEIDTEQRGDATIITATYGDLDPQDFPKGMINYNASPTMAMIGNRLILSSTKELAEELVELAASKRSARKRPENTLLQLNSHVARTMLTDNREHLIAQNMLENGHSREKAEREIGILLEVLKYVGDSSFRLTASQDTMRLELGLQFKSGE